MRELVEPTPVFERLYTGMMRDMHKTLTIMIARLVHLPPESRKAIICAHTVLGQMTGLKNGCAILKRRLDIDDYTENDIQDFISVIKMNTRGIAAAWNKS